MRFPRVLVVALLVGVCSTLAAHDLFLKLADYVVRPNTEARITALNGTFSTSSNSIVRSRVADLSLVGPAGRVRLDTSQLSAAGTRTVIKAPIGAPGTYVLGLSISPSQITLKGRQFNAYLKEEGLGHVVEARRAAGELSQGATERYAKHVKTVFQAGSTHTSAFNVVLGYPVEVVPLQNPYELHPGDTLKVQLLVNGAPATGIEVLAGGRTPAGAPIRTQHLRAGSDGIAAVALSAPGTWFVKFISMTRTHEPGVDYISQWATLTYAVLPAPRKAE